MVVSDKGEFYIINNKCELIEKSVYTVINYNYPRASNTKYFTPINKARVTSDGY